MKTIPFSIIATWPVPNYIDPPTTGQYALILNTLFLAFALLFVSLRVYGRATSNRWLGWDDVFIVIGAVLAVGLSASSILANYRYACNRHLWDIPPENWEYNLKLAIVAKIFFISSGAFVRQSILAFYLRLVGDAELPRAKAAIHCATAFNIATFLTFNVVSIVNCVPVSAYWHYPSDQYGSCVNEGAVVIASGAIVALLDIIIVLLPVWIIIRLQMPLRRKMGVGILLNLGLVSSAAAGLRTYYSWRAFVQTYDVTWWATPLWVCATVEIDLAIMCACAPAIRALLTEKAPWAIKPFRKFGNAIIHCLTGYVSPQQSYADTSTVVSSGPTSEDSQEKVATRVSYVSKYIGKDGHTDDILLTEREGNESLSSCQTDDDMTLDPIDTEAVIHATTQAIQGIGPLPAHLMNVHRRPDPHSEVERENERIINTMKRLHYQSEKADDLIVEAPISREFSTRRVSQDSPAPDVVDLPIKLMQSVDAGYGREGPPSRSTSQMSKHSLGRMKSLTISEEAVQRTTSRASRRDRPRSQWHEEDPVSASDDLSRPTSTQTATFRSAWAVRQQANMIAARQSRAEDPAVNVADAPVPAPASSAAAYLERPLPEEPRNFSRHTKQPVTHKAATDTSTVGSNTTSTHGGLVTFLSMESDSSTEDAEEEAQLQSEAEERARQRRADVTRKARRSE